MLQGLPSWQCSASIQDFRQQGRFYVVPAETPRTARWGPELPPAPGPATPRTPLQPAPPQRLHVHQLVSGPNASQPEPRRACLCLSPPEACMHEHGCNAGGECQEVYQGFGVSPVMWLLSAHRVQQ